MGVYCITQLWILLVVLAATGVLELLSVLPACFELRQVVSDPPSRVLM